MQHKSLEQVKAVIAEGRAEKSIKEHWRLYQQGLQYLVWLKEQKDAYKKLWPETEQKPVLDADGNATEQVQSVPIDYSNDESYVTFDEWLNEREQVEELRPVHHKSGSITKESVLVEGDLIREFKPDPAKFEAIETLPEYQSYLKRTGETYADSGVQVPFTKEDADGVLQIKAGFEVGLTSNNLKLTNGETLPLTAEAFPEFLQWFALKRAEFFK